MKKIIIISILSILTLLNYSCKKNGTGGKTIVHVEVFHHETPINGSVAYVKFNAKDAPVNPETNYDLRLEGEEAENHIHIENLRIGDYYIYVVGFDTNANQTVHGGIHVPVKWKQRKSFINVDLSVSE